MALSAKQKKRKQYPKKTSKQVRQEVTDRKVVVVDRLAGKSAKADVDYRPSHKESKSSCAECEHFLSPGNETSSCRRVAGAVFANDVCDLFVARKRER